MSSRAHLVAEADTATGAAEADVAQRVRRMGTGASDTGEDAIRGGGQQGSARH